MLIIGSCTTSERDKKRNVYAQALNLPELLQDTQSCVFIVLSWTPLLTTSTAISVTNKQDKPLSYIWLLYCLSLFINLSIASLFRLISHTWNLAVCRHCPLVRYRRWSQLWVNVHSATEIVHRGWVVFFFFFCTVQEAIPCFQHHSRSFWLIMVPKFSNAFHLLSEILCAGR